MKILIIEDEKELAINMPDYLTGRNYLSELAQMFHQALEKINVYHYNYIMLDLMLPGVHGPKILEKLKQQQKAEPKSPYRHQLSVNKRAVNIGCSYRYGGCNNKQVEEKLQFENLL